MAYPFQHIKKGSGTKVYKSQYFERNNLVKRRRLLCLLTIMAIFGFAAIFELIEWCYAALADAQSGTLFLGSGTWDVWDAQKDMLADGLGAICTTIFYCLLRPTPFSAVKKAGGKRLPVKITPVLCS